ncbi:hypothetical protein HPO96_34460 [Kribbella sandramycini]|uniref:LppP/LprE lipoprotein n=1 Tax=Kribbella sandramycini TaxID=60450 RepID=A0A7Y4P3S1_9ACTN|nr:hypothetical protein [Kribbella sandramycini]MBB6570135.1 hypothetical protein [Kribbella sandramycini]NOL45363.1 hypothetical protein [Kribbella sandramycini]
MRLNPVLVAGFELGLLITLLTACADDRPPAPPTTSGTPAVVQPATTAPTGATPTTPSGTGPAQGNGPLPAACTPQSVPALCVTFNLTGAATVTGSNWVYAEIPDPDLPDATCAEYGASTLESETPGLPKVTKVIGAQAVEATFTADRAGPDAPATGSLTVDDVTYEAEDATLTLNPDGSGKLLIPRLTSGSGSLAGAITWRCLDPK